MSLIKKLLIILLATAFIAAVIVISAYISSDISSKNEIIAYALGENKLPGTIGVELKYDNSTPDVMLQSPTGMLYNKKSADKYEINEETKTITIFVTSSETGQWAVAFNKKDNMNISYEMMIGAESNFDITDTDIIRLEDTYYLGFKINSTKDVTFHPTLTLFSKNNSTTYNLIIENDLQTITMSSTSDMLYIPLILPKDIYEEETAKLTLILQTDLGAVVSKSVNLKFTEQTVLINELLQEGTDATTH